MPNRNVVTIGNFDGVHVGHRRILEVASALATERAGQVIAITFEPAPAAALGMQPSPRLMTRAAKEQTLREAGATKIVTLEPTRELLALSPEAFVEQLVAQQQPAAVVEGENFRFGAKRQGDMAMLKSLGQQYGFDAIAIDPVRAVLHDLWAMPVSSSLVRELLSHGRVADATRVLGQPHRLEATVVQGEKRGRTIGVPTINLSNDELEGAMIPYPGVYAGMAELPDGEAVPAAISVGFKPTFGEHELVIEAHLLGFTGDLYDHRATLRFGRWLRDQHPFPSTELLARQLHRDIGHVRRWHETGLLNTLPHAS